ncbi:hypothetical protein MARHY3641 [Marinobacter nauticus ATCC 49840]|nr:hypothetical protein MARHY3641 [Marinobacter nauticus ATCC 49840]
MSWFKKQCISEGQKKPRESRGIRLALCWRGKQADHPPASASTPSILHIDHYLPVAMRLPFGKASVPQSRLNTLAPRISVADNDT